MYGQIVLGVPTGARQHTEDVSLHLLSARPGWRRQGAREYVHRFGARAAAIDVPLHFEPRSLATLVLRTEMKTFTADCEWRVASELRSMAERELQRLCSA